jgi:hypothetical protein
MTQEPKSNTDRFAKALGASRVVPVPDVSAEGPLGLLWLRAAVARDVRPSAATQTAAERAATEQTAAAEDVRLSQPEQWCEIERVAAELSRNGPRLDPLELAARLIAHHLYRPAGARAEGSRGAPVIPSPVLLDSFYEGFDTPADCLESAEAV